MDYTHDRRRRFYSSLLFWSGDMADAAIAVENQSHRRTAREITATAVVFTEENQVRVSPFISTARFNFALVCQSFPSLSGAGWWSEANGTTPTLCCSLFVSVRASLVFISSLP